MTIKWYNLMTQRDENGYPVGVYIKAFAQNPPVLYEINLNARSVLTFMDDSAHGMMVNERGCSVVPYYFGGTNGRSNLFSYPTQDNVSIGIATGAPFYRGVQAMLLQEHYLLLGTRDECLDNIDTVSELQNKATIQCYDESAYLCSADALLTISDKVFSESLTTFNTLKVTTNFFSKKWIIPRVFENDIRRGYALHEKNNHDDFVFKMVFTDIEGEPYEIDCDFECYTRKVNPFDSPSLWITFVDEDVVGVPYDFIQDQHTLFMIEPQTNQLTISTTRNFTSSMQDVVNGSLFFIMLVIIYRLTHTHSFHVHSNTNTAPKGDPQPRYHALLVDFFYRMIPLLSTVLSFVLLYNTVLVWYQFATTIYLQVVVIGSILLVRSTNELNNRYHFTLRVLNHQMYTDLMFVAVISTCYFLLADLIVTVLVAFHLALIYDSLVAAIFILPNVKEKTRFPMLLPAMLIETTILSLVEIYFFILPQMQILSSGYGGNLTVYLLNTIFFISVAAIGIALRAFTARTSSSSLSKELSVF